MGPIKRLDNIGIAVRDLERSLLFYVEVLELGLAQPYQPGQQSNAVLAGGVAFYIFATGHPGALGRAPERSPDLYQNPVGLDHLSFEVDDLERAAYQLEGRGVRFLGPAVDGGAIRYRAFHDPDGNLLYLMQRRSAPAAPGRS